ncbi:MAG: electron transport complex subunit RsxC [Clostridia bacterium]|nr:electron transport complex subunit RsxC [Clostridia bacterium]
MDTSKSNNSKASADKDLILPKKPYRTHGGVHVDHMKNTAEVTSEEIPTPKKIIVSMQQHIGAACEPIVKKGDKVTVGQLIADSQSFMCAPIHSGVSGEVTNIGTIIMPNGAEIKTIEIDSDGLQTVCSDIEPPVVTNADELYAAVRKSGLVGLGGAGFPVSIKLNFSPEKHVDTLVINGAECEPYLTADYREMMEYPEDIIEGTRFVMETLGLKRSIIGIEGNKPAAIKRLDEIIKERSLGDKICVLKLGTSYPHGAEKVLIKACTNRAVPVGKIPADAGCVVLNITSVSFIAKYVRTGMPLVSKRITVDGSAISQPKNVIAPVGTLISDIVEFCGGFKEEPKKVLMGGPMMGTALYTLDYPIIKQNNGLIFMDEKEADDIKPSDCIRCGRCVAACPMLLTPVNIQHFVERRDVQALNDLCVMSCMECGCCGFSCPARRPLVQYLRMAKSIVKSGR